MDEGNDDFQGRKKNEYLPRGTMTAFDLVNDLDQWNDTNESDVPKILLRDSVRSMTISEVSSEINFRPLVAKIAEYEIQKGTFLKGDYVLYEIMTEENGETKMRVHRTDADFFELRKLMLLALPYVQVPPLPNKSSKTTEKKIAKRKRHY